MRLPPVVVVHPLLFNLTFSNVRQGLTSALLCLSVSFCLVFNVVAEPALQKEPEALNPVINLDDRYMANLQKHTPAELFTAFQKAERLLQRSKTYPAFDPVVFVLHGEEANVFVRENYPANKQIVDLAAQLDAFGVIDVQICEYWMSENEVGRSELPAFVDTVSFGPAAEKRLESEGYLYF